MLQWVTVVVCHVAHHHITLTGKIEIRRHITLFLTRCHNSKEVSLCTECLKTLRTQPCVTSHLDLHHIHQMLGVKAVMWGHKGINIIQIHIIKAIQVQ